MTYEELRKFLKNTKKYPNCKKYPRAPLIHKGFPGTFNLSFTEYDMLKEFGGYSDFSHDLIFSTTQSCIRPQDILENIREGNDLWKYLGVFEMSDIGGQIVLSEKNDIEKVHAWQLNRLIEILVELGLKKENIYPSYQAGGKVSKITAGKYNFDFKIPEDKFTKELFIKEGIPWKNLIPDETRDTFLSLHINMQTPWGYRNEINYNIGTKKNPKFLDIATLEYFLWYPTYSSKKKVAKNINGLQDIILTVSVGGIGVERLYMAINGLKNIQEVDYLKKFYDLFKILYPKLTEKQRIKSGEALRALHRIFSDKEIYKIESLGRNRKLKVKLFIRIIIENIKEINQEKLKNLLELHSKVQPWHKELKKGIQPTIDRIKRYYQSQK